MHLNITTGPRRATVIAGLSITWQWPARGEGHHCHAKNCPLPCEPERLTCRRHWFMVPKALRDRVWATYRPGQCDDKNPSQAWHKAADAALAAIWAKELKAIETLEQAIVLAWPVTVNPLGWENFKSVARALLTTASRALWMDFDVKMDQKARTIVIGMRPRSAGRRSARGAVEQTG